MKLIYTLFFGTAESKLLPIPSLYLEKIRNNEAQLNGFLLPNAKGGDLHHHFSGSIYAEPI
jgi:adenosine deaminase/adenosine deaminase CECR1